MYDDNLASEAYISQVLNMPAHLKVDSMIAIGYPAAKKPPHQKESLQFEKIYLNEYGKSCS